jgi:hypothetical protein
MLRSTLFVFNLVKNIIQVCEISKHVELVSNKASSHQKLREFLVKEKPAVAVMKALVALIIRAGILRTFTTTFGSLVLKSKRIPSRA